MATITVDVLHDVTDAGDGQTTLREAIAAAAASDTIDFHGALAGGILVLTQGELVLNNSVTIDGDIDGDNKADITVDANMASRVFNITAGTSTLQSMTIVNGENLPSYYNPGGTGDGGGVNIATGAVVTFAYSTVSGSAAFRGGGIFGEVGSTVTLYSSTVSGNSTIGDGGGGIFVIGSLNATNTTIAGNSANAGGGSSGGGISGAGTATIMLTNTTVSGNSAANKGGGILNSGTLTINNTLVVGNNANIDPDISGLGGMLFPNNSIGFGADATTIFATTALVGGVQAGVLANNGGPVQTIALKADIANPALDAGDNTLVPAGVTTDANGNDRVAGAAVDIGATETQLVVTTLDDETAGASLAEDLADGNGLSLREAIFHATAGDVVTFAANLAGGTLRLINGELAPANAITIDGDVNGDEKADITISGDANNNSIADAGDSRIFNISGAGTSLLLSLNLTNGFSVGNGGAIFVNSGAGIYIADTTISNSVTGVGGGAIFAQSSVTLRDVLLTGNTAGYGGGLYITGATGTLIQTTIHNNTATSFGGGITASIANLSIYNSTIIGNQADSNGGATGNGGGLDLFGVGTVAITNTVIAENTSGTAFAPNDVNGTIDTATNSFIGTATASAIGAYGGGGAGATNNGGGAPGLGALADNGGTTQTRDILPGSGLIDNGFNPSVFPALPDANGNPRINDGIVDIGATEFRLTVTTAADETVGASLAADIADGAGLSLREAIFHAGVGQTVFFDDALAGQTLALANGAGFGELAITQDVNIDGDIDGENRADITISGGNAVRIFNISGATTDVDLLSLTLINGNTGGHGGAIYANTISTLDILDSTISNNVAGLQGGGLRALSTDVSLTNVLLSGNSAGINGGGAAFGNSSTATLTNTTIHGNSSNYRGGGIYNSGSSTTSIFNSTITNNQADADGASGTFGGGIANYKILNVTNSIIAGNTSGSGGSEIADDLSGFGVAMNATNTLFGIDESAILNVNTNNQIGPANLGQLLDNGGTTLTRSPLDGSLAIQNGDNALLPVDTQDVDGDSNTAEDLPIDARGFFRTAFGVTDLGAVEQRVDETITGTAVANNIIGGLGTDNLSGLAGDDTLDGGANDDTADYSGETQSVEVRLNLGTAVGASSGSDTLISIENVEGSNFDDLIFGDNFANLLNGNGGNDDIFALGDDDTVNGGDGNDTLNGNLDGDVMNGDAGDDLVLGAQGNDLLNGGADNDTVSGGNGNDTVSGGSGVDLVFGGGNDDTLFGNDGNDVLSGGGGLDTVSGGNDDDLVLGAGAADLVLGGAGADTVSGGTGVDIVDGGSGNDEVFGASGNDTVSGGAGNDTVSGGTENDDISGNSGADNLIGASGVDRLDGGTGNDILTGGSGADTLVFAQGYEFDTVQGFEDNIDTLELDDALWGGGLTAAQVVATFATQLSPGIVEFDFTGGDILRVVQGAGITTTALIDDIAIV